MDGPLTIGKKKVPPASRLPAGDVTDGNRSSKNTFTLQALFVDGGISIPLYWIRPGDKLVLNGEEFENITVSVVGWTWSAGGGGIKAEANAVETDIIKLLSQVA